MQAFNPARQASPQKRKRLSIVEFELGGFPQQSTDDRDDHKAEDE
jgi:hypothetical protein